MFIFEYFEWMLGLGLLAAFLILVKIARGSGKQLFLMQASHYGDDEEVDYILNEIRWLREAADANGFTPLHLAALAGHAHVLEVLFKHKVNVNSKNKAGMTPLHAAAMSGRSEIVKILLENGAKVNIQDKLGNTPLYFAVWDDNVEVILLLLEHGSDPSIKTGKGESPLQRARILGHTETIQLLEEADKGKTNHE